MAVFARVGVVAGLLVVLVGCGGESSPPDKPFGAPGKALTAPGDDLCEALPRETVREHTGMAVRATEPLAIAEDTDSCTYQLDSADDPMVSTELTTLHRTSDKPMAGYLDEAFADRPGAEPDPYEKVDGMGEAAGIGPSSTTRQLVIITSDDKHVYKVTLWFTNLGVRLDQARPLAERLFDGLDG